MVILRIRQGLIPTIEATPKLMFINVPAQEALVNGGEKARKSGGHFWCLDKSQARREASSLPSPLILDNGPERGAALR